MPRERTGNGARANAFAAVLALQLILLAVAARADADPKTPPDRHAPISGDLRALSDAEIERRIALLARDFEAGQRYAKYWQWGFTGAWSTGIALGAVQAGVIESGKDRVPGIVTATKGAIGTTRLLLDPVPGRLGTEPLDVAPGSSRNALEARLAAGEEHLLRIEKKAHDRDKWYTHAANVAINGAGGGVIVAFGHPSDAYLNVGVGVLFGEIMIFTKPRRGIRDLEAYRSALSETAPRAADPAPSLSLVPHPGGLGVALRF